MAADPILCLSHISRLKIIQRAYFSLQKDDNLYDKMWTTESYFILNFLPKYVGRYILALKPNRC